MNATADLMQRQDEMDRWLKALEERTEAEYEAARKRQSEPLKGTGKVHKNSLTLMETLLDKYAPESGLCVDVGSYNVNGTYRQLVEGRGLKYLGIDIAAGPNVDKVVPEGNIGSGYCVHDQPGTVIASLVISGQCLEHTKRPWEWLDDIKCNVLSPGVPLILIAPAMWPQHRYPVDCWRILPDGMQALMEWAGLTVLEVGLSKIDASHADCWGVGRM